VRRQPVIVGIACALALWAAFSYWSAGIVYVLVNGTPGQGPWLQQVRDLVAGWGRLAPVLYTLAVVVEVIVAPIPGTLLYAPAGAIFGGFVGGTLSLIGNVIGAAIACAIGSLIGDRVIRKADATQFGRYRELLRERGLWVVLLLRINPLTSSDLVSYAAGVAGVPVWKVATGTLLGMAPLCYLQSYFAERLFELVPGRYLILGGSALVAVLVLLVVRGARRDGILENPS
jgi:uncharacterized membrane protein YdjX (TVP38/TMEM64 family)